MIIKNKNILKRNIAILLALSIGVLASAQINSPYSRYGLGKFQNKESVRSSIMGGTGVANRSRTDLNYVNPAALTAMDSTTVLFDVAFNARLSNFQEDDYNKKIFSGNIDYVSLMIPLMKFWFAGVSVQPISSVGYNINSVKTYNGDSDADKFYVTNYDGNGGMSMVTLTNSFKIPGGFSIGAEVGMMWGNHDETITESYDNMDINYSSRRTAAYHTGWWLSGGLQYEYNFDKVDLILGGTYEAPTRISSYEEKTIQTAIDYVDNTTSKTVESNMPQGFGAGVSVNYNKQLIVSADYKQKQWEDSEFGIDPKRFVDNNIYSLGLELVPNHNSNKYFDRIAYRLGAHYESGSFKVVNKAVQSGYISAGLGLPSRMSGTILNVGFEFGTTGGFSVKHITENYFQINVGLNLGEKWFTKPKFY